MLCGTRGINQVSGSFGPLDNQGSLVQGFSPNVLYPHLGNRVNTRLVCVRRGDSGRAVQEAKGVLAEINLVNLKIKRMLVGHPAGQPWLYRLQIIWSSIQKHAAGPAAHPLQ